jgi:YidC/Oxa1 family membrane protein insertase
MRRIYYLLFIIYYSLFVIGDVISAAVEIPTPNPPVLKAADVIRFGVNNAQARTITLGSVDPKSGYKFRLELSSKGAAIRKAVFSGFNDCNYKNPQPLAILTPTRDDGGEILAMSNTGFIFVQPQLQLPLDKLHWKSFDVETMEDGSQIARFEAIIKTEDTGKPAVVLTKTYKVVPDSYLIDCRLTIENLTDTEQKIQFNLVGPVGIGQEDVSRDDKKVVGGFRESQGQPAEGGSAQAGLQPVVSVRLDAKKLSKAEDIEKRRLTKGGAGFLWAAITNKYFAAILAPVPDPNKETCDWVVERTGQFYNPDGDKKADSGDETVGVDLKTAPVTLGAAGQGNSSKIYAFKLYLGPKDKSLFDKDELYRKLGFVQTIDFMACCCPSSIINPLAFGILWIMKLMHGFPPHNYGVVIIVLVFLVRLLLHPITKMSQVSMSKFSKLAPKAEEIKKKYANSKPEMNKQLMALYKEQGATPIMGLLPMMVQMPVWIALYSAIYASVDLRGAAFLPFWITDLSAPDAVLRFMTFNIPLFGKVNSLNLLPILMALAFYMQQKLMPAQAQGAATPEAAQQQKIMSLMMTVLFPLMLYRAPSGLNLYIMSSTFAGVIEQYVIRKHIRKKEEAESQGLVAVTSKTGGKVKKKKPKPFFRF